MERDRPSLDLMVEVFSCLPVRVIPVHDSRQAALLINSRRFDGIILNVAMPPVCGLELTEKVRASLWNRSTPIIVMTEGESGHAMQRAFHQGACFYVHKPLDPLRLMALWRTMRGSLLENRRRYIRVPLQTEVVCKTGHRTVRALSCNLSLGGIQIDAEDLEQGEPVQLSFCLPISNVTVEACGMVVWAKEHRRGIQFTEIGSENEAAIHEFIVRVEQRA
ncbi:MAG TPA: response regulator [Terriglobales bacterium]|nr:response regulator [Terriglobales bacterium]